MSRNVESSKPQATTKQPRRAPRAAASQRVNGHPGPKVNGQLNGRARKRLEGQEATQPSPEPEKAAKGPENGLPGPVGQTEFLAALAKGLPGGSHFLVAERTERDTLPAKAWREQYLDGVWYFSTGASNHRRLRQRPNMVAFRAIVLDDVGTLGPPVNKVDRAKVLAKPTWDLETSPGNHQLGFMLKGWSTDIQRGDDLMEGLVAAGLQDDGVNRACRLFRIPDSLNNKKTLAEPFKAKLHYFDESQTYTLTSLSRALKVKPGNAPVPSTEHPAAVTDGNEMYAWLAEQGMLAEPATEGFIDMVCPFAGDADGGHTDGRIYARFKPITGNQCVAECWHGHGKDKKAYRVRFLNWVLEQGGPAVGTRINTAKMKKMYEGLARAGHKVLSATTSSEMTTVKPEAWDFTDRTDAGNCALLKTLTDGGMRFVPELKLWIFWTGTQWVRDDQGTYFETSMLRLAHLYIEQGTAAFAKASKIEDDAERKKAEKAASTLISWGHQCRDRKRLSAMREGARVYPGLPIGAAALDTHRHLLGVANGVVDLRTGELKPDARDDFVTLRSPYAYKPEATAPRWTRFVREISGLQDGTRRPALEQYHQTRAGYILTGEVREQKFFNDTGRGSNGKNVLNDQMGHILGPMYYEMPQGAFEKAYAARDSNGPSPTLHGLMHKRLAVAAEWTKGRQVDMVMLLRVTGNEHLTTRDLHGKNMTTPITAKLVFPSNDPLETGGGVSPALKGRTHVVPFSKKWNRPDEVDRDPALPDGDKDLKHTLHGESEGVLAWAVQGAVAYYRQGLTLPQEVADATRSYITKQNPFAEWYGTLTILGEDFDTGDAPHFDRVYKHYAEHCVASGQQPAKESRLAAMLADKGVPKGKYGKGENRTRYGLVLP